MWQQSLERFWTQDGVQHPSGPFRGHFGCGGGFCQGSCWSTTGKTLWNSYQQQSHFAQDRVPCFTYLHSVMSNHGESCGVMWNQYTISVVATGSHAICFRSLVSGTSTKMVHSQPVVARSTVDEKHSAWRRLWVSETLDWSWAQQFPASDTPNPCPATEGHSPTVAWVQILPDLLHQILRNLAVICRDSFLISVNLQRGQQTCFLKPLSNIWLDWSSQFNDFKPG